MQVLLVGAERKLYLIIAIGCRTRSYRFTDRIILAHILRVGILSDRVRVCMRRVMGLAGILRQVGYGDVDVVAVYIRPGH